MRNVTGTALALLIAASAMGWEVQVWRGDPNGIQVLPSSRRVTISNPGDYGLRAVENGAPAELNAILVDAGGPVSLDVAWDAAGSDFGASRIGSINETAASLLTIKRCAIETTLGHAGSSAVSTVEGHKRPVPRRCATKDRPAKQAYAAYRRGGFERSASAVGLFTAGKHGWHSVFVRPRSLARSALTGNAMGSDGKRDRL